jgi:hypothetical protein
MKFTRRTLLFRASAGAAAAGALIAVPTLLGTGTAAAEHAPAGRSPAPASNAASSEPVVAYIRDTRRGEIALYVGTREIIRHDPELVSRLLQAGA